MKWDEDTKAKFWDWAKAVQMMIEGATINTLVIYTIFAIGFDGLMAKPAFFTLLFGGFIVGMSWMFFRILRSEP